MTKSAGLGHNRSDYSERAILFILCGNLAEANAAVEEAKAEQKAVYAKAKNLGFSKKDIDLALKLQSGDEKIIEQHKRAAEIARLMMRPFSEQMELPLEDDSEPYLRGYEIGLKGAPAVSNYAPGSPEYNEWQKGLADGNKARNEALMEMARREEEGEDDDVESDDFDALENEEGQSDED